MAYGNTARDGTGDFWHMLQDALGRQIITTAWTPTLVVDEAANDSDKSLTVPASTEYRVQWIWVEYTSTAVAGNRQLEIQIQDDAADVIAEVKVGVVQAASLTRYYILAPHLADLSAGFRDTDWLMTPMPEWYLPAGYVIRIWDNAAVDAAADDMIIQCMVLSRGV